MDPSDIDHSADAPSQEMPEQRRLTWDDLPCLDLEPEGGMR